MATYSKDFIVKNGLQVGGHIMPDDNETYDLGSPTKKFRDLYLSAGTIYLGSLVLKDNGDGTVATYESDGVTAASIQANAVDIDYDNTTSGMTATNAKAALDELMAAVEAIDTAGELAYDNATSGLTATTVKGAIDEIVAEEDANVKALLTNLDGNIIPSADIMYDLGSPTKQWKDVYVGPGSLYLNGTKVLEDDSGTLKFNADPNQAMTISTTGTAAITVSGGNALNFQTSELNADIALNPTGDIELNADVVIGAGQALTTSNGSALTVNSNLALGSNTVTAATFFGNLTGNISATSGTTTMNNLVVDGNLTVGGTTTTVNTETINLADNIITLNSNATGTPSQNGGIEVERGDSTNVTLRWNEFSDKWEVTEDGATYKEILLDGDVPATAAEATKLATARTIGGVSFDGTADINLPGVNTAGNQDTSGNAASATKLASARTITLNGDVSGSASFDGSANATITATIADDSHNHTTSNIDGFTEAVQDITGGMWTSNSESGVSVTYQDVDGTLDINVNDPTITLTGAVTGSATMTNLGNVSIATTATADPTLTINGDASGSATFTNLGNATLTLTIADDSHNHTIANVDGLQTALDAGFVSASANNDTITFTTAGGTTSSVTISDAVLSTEQVQDIIGGMVSSNTETGIGVTYNDSTGKLDFSVTAAGVVTAGSNLSYSGSTLNVASSPTFSGTVTAGDFNSTSDERLKTNVETIADAGSKVAALRGVNFDWKESGAKTMGVIAQEVEAVIPEVVATDDEGMKSVNYQAMVGLLIEAVKELQAKVDAHEAKCECGK